MAFNDRYRQVKTFRDEQTNAVAVVTQSIETGEYTVKFGKNFRERGSTEAKSTAFLTLRQLDGVERLIVDVRRWVAEQTSKGDQES